MKTITKVILTTAITIIPLGIFAQEKFEEHEGFENKFSKHNKYLGNKKGINYSFEGKLQSKPKDGLNGVWTIDNIKVLVNEKTFIKQSNNIIKIGDSIEIKAKRIDNKIIAIILEQEDGFFK